MIIHFSKVYAKIPNESSNERFFETFFIIFEVMFVKLKNKGIFAPHFEKEY
jgi:hypothetical protein